MVRRLLFVITALGLAFACIEQAVAYDTIQWSGPGWYLLASMPEDEYVYPIKGPFQTREDCLVEIPPPDGSTEYYCRRWETDHTKE